MASGEPPAERVVVKMDCGTQTRPQPQDYTDSDGFFSFSPGVNRTVIGAESSLPILVPNMWRNPSQGSERGPRGRGIGLSNCVIHVELPGYRSDRLRLRGFFGLGGFDVGVLVLHPLDGFTGSAFSPTTRAAPKAATLAFQKGLAALSRQGPKYKQANQKLEKVVGLYPQFAAAWWALGEARSGLKDEIGAGEAYMRSMAADPVYLRPYESLMALACRRKDWPAVESLGESYLALSPGSSKILYRVAVAATNQGEFDRAEKFLEAVFARGEEARWPRTHVIMGLVHESRSDFDEAGKCYRAFLRVAPDAPLAEAVKNKLAELNPVPGVRP